MRVWTTFKDTHRSKGIVKMSREGHVRVVREGIVQIRGRKQSGGMRAVERNQYYPCPVNSTTIRTDVAH